MNTTLEDDADYQLALELSAALNGDGSATAGPNPYHDVDADLALAWQLQDSSDPLAFSDDYTDYLNSRETSRAARSPAVPKEAARVPDHDDTRISEYEDEILGPREPLANMAQFMRKIDAFSCSKCKHRLLESALDVQLLFQEWRNDLAKLSSLLVCRHCQTPSLCISCSPQAENKLSRVGRCGKQVSWCCPDGRLFLTWVLLCGFDQRYCKDRAKAEITPPKTPDNSASKRRKPNRRHDVRSPLSSSLPQGTGFGGSSHSQGFYDDDDDVDYYEDNAAYWGHVLGTSTMPKSSKQNRSLSEHVDKRSPAQDKQQARDRFSMMMIGILQDLLPSFERSTYFDNQPPDALKEMLCNSKIMDYCAELLRNDSLQDATSRSGIYTALFDFLQTMASHWATNQVLLRDRPTWPDSVNLLTLSFNGKQDKPKETSSPLIVCARNLFTQSGLILKNARNNGKEFGSIDGQDLLRLCHKMSDLSSCVQTYAAEDNRTQISSSDVETIIGVPDEKIYGSHSYAHEAKALGTSKPGRLKRLITELTTLTTGLPPGIYIRYCEDRPDVMKCCIIGPKGTPYENGLFEFDLFCGPSFPDKPPMVKFKGTGGGRVSINPNLYPDGKVCLSLLGTWSGEPWNPHQSTILQILVSIQAMILCDTPWYNEPGREVSDGRRTGENPRSIQYNHKIRERTVRHAMLTWLEKPPSLWKDIVDYHFKQNANSILQNVSEWAKAKARYNPDPRSAASALELDELMALASSPGENVARENELVSTLPKLQIALKVYGSTFVIPNIPKPVVQKQRRTKQRERSSSPPPLTPSGSIEPSPITAGPSIFQSSVSPSAHGQPWFQHPASNPFAQPQPGSMPPFWSTLQQPEMTYIAPVPGLPLFPTPSAAPTSTLGPATALASVHSSVPTFSPTETNSRGGGQATRGRGGSARGRGGTHGRGGRGRGFRGRGRGQGRGGSGINES